MNKFLALVLIILVSGAAFFTGSMMKKGGSVSSNASLKLAEEVIGNPIVTNITLEGKVEAIDSDSVTLERDGKKLKAYFGLSSTFGKLNANGDLSATPSAVTAISELPIGSEVFGGATIQKDASSNEFRIYTTNFLVK